MHTQHATETHKELFHPGVSHIDQGRIVARITKDHALDEARATAIFEETLRFLGMAASYPGKRFAPSEEVDKGWHTFLLYTKAYRAFCKSLGGKFIDHEPNDLVPSDGPIVKCDTVSANDDRALTGENGHLRTVRFMEMMDIPFNRALWPIKKAAAWCSADNCTATDCYQGDDD